MNRPDKQHFIPRVYLKYFKNDSSHKNESVWILNFKNKFRVKIEQKPLNSEIFTSFQFYNSDIFIEDGYGLELELGKTENEYHNIINEITNEVNLTIAIREKLLTYLISAKLRSPIFRSEEYKRFLDINNFVQRHYPPFQKYKALSDEDLKQMQLIRIINPETWKILMPILIAKKWVIYKTVPERPFITSDNPGYKLDLNNMKKLPDSYWHNLNKDAIIVFPLTPIYCLTVGPFGNNVDVHINAFNYPVEYVNVYEQTVIFINLNTRFTCDKMIISNSKWFMEFLEKKANEPFH